MLYSEYCASIGKKSPRYHDAQLYGTKKCGRCDKIESGFAEKDHPLIMRERARIREELLKLLFKYHDNEEMIKRSEVLAILKS